MLHAFFLPLSNLLTAIISLFCWLSWQNVAIYALWGMWPKCRDLRALPGTKFRLLGTFNYSAPLAVDLNWRIPTVAVDIN